MKHPIIKELLILFIGVMFLLLLVMYKHNNKQKLAILDLKALNYKADKDIENLRKYPLICIRINDICNKFKSSREEKLKDVELMKLMTKIK